MRERALLIEALPRPIEGPWVPLVGGDVWWYRPGEVDLQGRVFIEVDGGTGVPTSRFALDGSTVEVIGARARVVIEEEFNGPNVTVVLHAN